LADVVIYSPTIEAGVSFDVPGHFDKLYGFVCGCSCSQRSYFQMMSRVRKFNTNEFNIYTDLKYDAKSNPWTFEEIDNKTLYNKDVVLDNEYVYDSVKEETLIVRKNELYRTIYIHNLVEEKNKNQKVFLKLFYETAYKKGYDIKHIDCDSEFEKSDKKLLTKYLEILDSENIDSVKYEEYCQIQRNGKATKAMKLAVQKRSIMNLLGLDSLSYTDEESKLKAYMIVKKYSTLCSFKNFIALIDEQNIKDSDELQSLNRKQIITYYNQIISMLGFNNCLDKKNITNNQFIKNCKDVCILLAKLSKDSIFNQLCNMSKEDYSYLVEKDLNTQMRKINVLLNGCCIKITNVDKSHKKDSGIYALEVINHMDEVLSNKITYTKFKFYDSSNIFTKVEPNYFKQYISKMPIIEMDTSLLDIFVD
jgi:hypothetical protein